MKRKLIGVVFIAAHGASTRLRCYSIDTRAVLTTVDGTLALRDRYLDDAHVIGVHAAIVSEKETSAPGRAQ